jgi:hypothetical protein
MPVSSVSAGPTVMDRLCRLCAAPQAFGGRPRRAGAVDPPRMPQSKLDCCTPPRTPGAAQSFRSCLCADEMDAPILGPSRDDVSGGPMLHALNCRVKVRRVPSARSVCIYLLELPGTQARVVVPKDEIHDVCLAVAQLEQTHPKQYARVAVPGFTARSAVARTRRHVAGCLKGHR